MENIDRLIKFGLMVLIIVAIMMQIKVVNTILKNSENLDADPLVYGAQRYGIESCECEINKDVRIIFNNKSSRTIITQHGVDTTFKFNLTWDKEK